MPKIKFANILKTRMKENAILYLNNKQKSKGKEITYTNIEMADYLQQIKSKLTIEQKQHNCNIDDPVKDPLDYSSVDIVMDEI